MVEELALSLREVVLPELGSHAGRAREGVAPGGDVITKIDGREVSTGNDLGIIIANRRPGETVTLELVRDGERRTVEVELDERPEQVDRP